MKIDSANPYPYLPLPVDTPNVLQQEHMDVKQEVADEQTEVKSRELVAQQAGAHAFSQVQQNSFVDATLQTRNDLLLAKKPTDATKRGMKRSLATNQEVRDPGQGPMTSGFQLNKDRQSEPLLESKSSLANELSSDSSVARGENGQEMPIRLSRRPVIRASVRAAQSLLEKKGQGVQESSQAPTQSVVSDNETPKEVSNFALESILNLVSDALSGTWNDKGVVAQNWQTAHTSLSQLEPKTREDVIPKLDSMQLGLYMEGLERPGAQVSTADKSSMYESVAKSATREQLASSLEHIADRGNLESDKGVLGLGQAIGHFATDESKSHFVQDAKSGLTEGANRGAAIAHAMAGLGNSPETLNMLLQGFSPEQLGHLVAQASGKNVSVSMSPEAGATLTTSYNAEPLADLLQTVSGLPDTGKKQLLGEMSRSMLQEITSSESSPEHLVVKNNSSELLQNVLLRW